MKDNNLLEKIAPLVVISILLLIGFLCMSLPREPVQGDEPIPVTFQQDEPTPTTVTSTLPEKRD